MQHALCQFTGNRLAGKLSVDKSVRECLFKITNIASDMVSKEFENIVRDTIIVC